MFWGRSDVTPPSALPDPLRVGDSAVASSVDFSETSPASPPSARSAPQSYRRRPAPIYSAWESQRAELLRALSMRARLRGGAARRAHTHGEGNVTASPALSAQFAPRVDAVKQTRRCRVTHLVCTSGLVARSSARARRATQSINLHERDFCDEKERPHLQRLRGPGTDGRATPRCVYQLQNAGDCPLSSRLPRARACQYGACTRALRPRARP